MRKQVVELAQNKYEGFNHQHLTEFLGEREGLVVSRSSVRRILLEAEIRSPKKRRSPLHRRRRERYAKERMLLQIDGSRYDWLEGRESWLTLISSIDDATGKVPFALFGEQDDSQGIFCYSGRLGERSGCHWRYIMIGMGSLSDLPRIRRRPWESSFGAKTFGEANQVLKGFFATF